MDSARKEEQLAEAREIILEQMKVLRSQTDRMIAANSATPAQNIAALSHEIAELGRLIVDGRV